MFGRDDDSSSKPKRPDAAPSSRFGRLARLGALAPKAIPFAAEAIRKAMGGERTEDEEFAAHAKLLLEVKKTADAMLATLGEMKGLPLKFGQMASYIDGLAPPGYEEKFHSVLSKLQQKAPPLSVEAARQAVTRELGGSPEELFESFELEPFAAASIGQVHRARTRTGDDVAVKVQYPGIDKAVENDLKSVSLIEQMIAPIGRKYHTKETLEEVRRVFLAELDYGQEAEHAELFRAMHEGDDSIVVPRVFHSLSSKRVLTTELIGGVDYATFVAEASEEEKSAAGLTIARFMFRALFKYGWLYADPHPGNYRFLGGGRVAFLDYGCVRRLPDELVAGMKRYTRALQDGDDAEFERACVEVLGYDPTDAEGWPIYTSYTRVILEPIVRDGEFTYTHEFAREAVAYLVRNGRGVIFKEGQTLPSLPKPIHMPPEHTFVNRLQWGLASVLAGLGARGNWRALIDDWLRGPVVPVPGR
jgi:predicted unusual protein kinase regulating ubiquinone biosynthesis (AarF/ABC1/UbiB family)